MVLHTFHTPLRDASSGSNTPWTEVHGYRHPVAPRPRWFFTRSAARVIARSQFLGTPFHFSATASHSRDTTSHFVTRRRDFIA